jgi:SNF2 family DNA or RNA helicase
VQTDWREKELIKAVPGAKWDTDARVWWLPLSWSGCVQLRGTFGENLQVGVQLAAWSRHELESRVTPCMALRTADDSEDLAMMTKLYPYQRAGAKFLATAKHALIADEMGTGKTVQAIAALESIGDSAYPALIVCPNSMKPTWVAEWERWAPGRAVQLVHGGAATRRKQIEVLEQGEADIAIMNWEGLRLHTRLDSYPGVALSDDDKTPKELNSVPWKSVVADEAHRAKEPSAKQTRALWYVGRDAEYRFALTGTPVANSPEDVWALMRFVEPSEFPAKTKFIDRYGLQSWNAFGFMEVIGVKSETKDELFKILDPRFIRRTKAAVLPQLPPKTYATRFVDLTAKQRKAYDMLRKEMMTELESGVLLATNPLTRMTRLLQFAAAYGELQDDQLILTEPSCKVDALEEIVDELGDQQAVVFAESRQLIELAAKRLHKNKVRNGQVTGAIDPLERQKNVEAFQAGALKVLLLTLGAGGEGLTLTAASTAIFLQRSWSQVKNLQAEDRIHRVGQAGNVEIIDIIAEDTVESRVHDARVTKADRLEEIARDAETLKVWLAK